MKLLENENKLSAGEGLSLQEICNRACRAHFEGHVEQGNAYLRLLNPSDGEPFIRAHCFLSQMLSFSRNYDLALDCALGVLNAHPNSETAIHHAVLVHCYRGEYEQASKLHASYRDRSNPSGYDYQSACILAGLDDYEAALIALDKCFESGGIVNFYEKLWYDPELSNLWNVLFIASDEPEVREILSKAYWADLLDSYDPYAPFDQLDPGNLRSVSHAEMYFVGVVPRGPMAFLIEERREDDPMGYDALISRLKDDRERSVQGLKHGLSMIC